MDAKKTMTDDIQKTGFGERLKNARESQRMSAKDAAARLHLTPAIIEILETEALHNAPPATFMRGYLRSYARLLNFSDQEINIALEQLGLNIEPTSIAVSPLLNTSNLYKSDRYTNWITYFIVLVLAVMVGTWWNNHPHYSLQNTFNHNTEAQQIPVQLQPAPVSQPAAVVTTAPLQPVSPVGPSPAPTPVPDKTKNIEASQPSVATNPMPATPMAPAPVATAPQPPAAAATAAGVPQPVQPGMAPSTAGMANNPVPGAAPGAVATPLLQDAAFPATNVASDDKTDKHKKSHSDDRSTALLPEPGLDGSD